MADWSGILNELQRTRGDFDGVRRKYLKTLSNYTGRNVIAYYSGWLQKPTASNLGINDLDKNGFMAAMKGLDRKKGLDLILHTPGGDVAATESIIDYVCKMFSDVRVIVPQLAMSGGTMIACSSNLILMGKHSSLGPIDPQFGNLPAHGILEEFKMAKREIAQDPNNIYVWQPIISKYNPTLIGECTQAIKWAEDIARNNLSKRMFSDLPDGQVKKDLIDKILTELGDHSVSFSHARHFSFDKCKDMGLRVMPLEDDQTLQENVLSVHHAMMHTLGGTYACKIIENHKGSAVIQQVPATP